MTSLADYQFEILPTEEAPDGFVFGIGADVSIDGESGFDPGENTWMTQDQDNARRGVKGFGRDVLGGRTWAWESHTDKDDATNALAVLDDFSAAWSPDAAEEPGWVTAVRYRLAGRYRRVYGRPRRYAAPPSNLILTGFVPVTHDFQCVDAFTYDDAMSSVEVPYVSTTTSGGWKFPAKFPVATTSTAGVGGAQAVVDGTARAYPIIRFNGPWTNPSIRTDQWTLKWKGAVRDGGYVEIDCRPWKLTVTDETGASVVGGLDRTTWLEDCWFAPKSRPQITLGGSAASGAASASVSWRNTWKSI